MTYRGVIHGKLIELEESTPFADGLPVEVSVQPCEETARPGNSQFILDVVRQAPHLSGQDVDEFERAIRQGRNAGRKRREQTGSRNYLARERE